LLEDFLQKKGLNTSDVWASIMQQEGSIQHLDQLTEYEKSIFKTAFELDQRWLIELAADRQPYICQAQSLNVFLPSDVHKKVLHEIHYSAWEKKVKSMYYLRSRALQRPESQSSADALTRAGEMETTLPLKYEECLACQ
jgi:ribonucleoside-diphosphate reductase alpha chain